MRLFLVSIVMVGLFGQSYTRPGNKYLAIPMENLEQIKLILKDELTGSEIEAYPLESAKHETFIEELNAAESAPNLKMNICCYAIIISYKDGREISIPTNGKGLGPTPVGYFLLEKNIVFRYFPISKAQYCKPIKGEAENGGAFGF